MDELKKATLDPEYKESPPPLVKVMPPTAKQWQDRCCSMPVLPIAVNVAPMPIVEYIAPAPVVSWVPVTSLPVATAVVPALPADHCTPGARLVMQSKMHDLVMRAWKSTFQC